MSATYTRTKLLIASTLFAALCITSPVNAAPASGAGQGQPSVVTPMTRADVERILREAQSAIAKGQLDAAEKLVARAENARIHYSMFHFGDTPASVRRDLNRARRTAGLPSSSPAAKAVQDDAASQTALNMFSQKKDAVNQGTVDPFAARSRATANDTGLPARGDAKLGATDVAANDLPSEQALPAQQLQRLPAPGTNDNPFVKKTSGSATPGRYELNAGPGGTPPGDVAKTSPSQDTSKATSQPSRYAQQPGARTNSEIQPVQYTEVAPPAPPQDPAARAAAEELPAPIFGVPISGEPPATANAETADPSLIDTADASQQVLARQLSTEVGKRQSEAKRLHTEDPERALAILREAQQMVKDSKLPESAQRELLTRIDITLGQVEKFAKGHSGEIELDKQNEEVLQSLDREREVERKIKQEIADGIEEFNKLRDEHRYAEAEIVARRLYELDPLDPTTQQVLQTAKFIRREMLNRELSMAREEGNQNTYEDVERATIPNVGDENPLVFDPKRWEGFAKKRVGRDRQRRRTDREREIEKQLKMPVQLRYEDTPLSQVMDELSKLTGINIYLDPLGLSQEGVNSDTPVDLPLNKEISLESALNLILEPLHLSYVVKDDVLKITSEQLRDGEIYPVTYNVSDLVIPIPNFVPSSNIGLQGLINEAHAASNPGQKALGMQAPAVMVNDRGQQQTGPDGQVLAQQFGATPGAGMSQSTVPIGSGPGGMGAGANADFDSLIDLIVSTVSTETWAENGGGEAEIRPFPTNLSLVISQTQAVHEEIADLLEQLRRLQDLQVTIEVRFIRLNDSFFERIGIDFDMDVNDNGYNGNPATTDLQPFGPRSNTVGAVRAVTGDLPAFTSDLDIPFRQNSFDITQVVPFGGPVSGGLNFGFAILSDIEAYFLIEAAQGDTRTNVLNAPKVTLFNGQQAFVADTTQRPFVVGVIPVVGEFAAAQQPVIVVLNEGTMMTIQAVVSEDRRYVRMTIVPFFTQIGDVDEFTFEGSASSSSSSSSSDDDEDGKNEAEEESEEVVRSGVTVQLPSFSFVSVVTTVSVPDGGTVLLGGIKRLSEGRNEFGVPLLSKVPYINRLFRNISIGRETDSLMMMVTPRIIIQEEEEERLGIQVP